MKALTTDQTNKILEMSNSDWRSDPATEKQKEKLRFFGCTWDEGISKGQASDALRECVRLYPDVEATWRNRPPTAEQLNELLRIGEAPEYVRTYGQAKDLIKDYELSEKRTAEQKQLEYYESEEFRVEQFTQDVNFDWADDYREVTREEVAKAWALLKSRNVETPSTVNLLDALEELFQDFKAKPTKPGVLTFYCLYCRGTLEIKPPPIALGRQITLTDFIDITVTCTHCGRETDAKTIRS